MAGRNRKDTADYFSHDSDASSDEKVVYLESLFGHTGYAVYFKFLERMVRAKNFEIEWNDIKKIIYAKEFSISVTEIDRIVSECCRKEIKAFELVDGKLFSAGLKKRMQPLLEKREYNRLKYEAKKKGNQPECKDIPISVTEIPISVTEIPTESYRNGTVKERKVKKRIVKKSKEEEPIPAGIILPDWLPTELWQTFIEHREGFKPKLTARAEILNLNRLIKFHEQGYDCEEILNTTIASGWKSFFEPNGKTKPVNDGSDIEYI